MQAIALLQDGNDGVGFVLGRRLHAHCFVPLRVKNLANRVFFLQPEPGQRTHQLPARQAQPFGQAAVSGSAFQPLIEAVDHRNQFAQKAVDGKPSRLFELSLGSFLQIVHLGPGPQQRILEHGHFLRQRRLVNGGNFLVSGDFAVRRLSGAGIDAGMRFGTVTIIGRAVIDMLVLTLAHWLIFTCG